MRNTPRKLMLVMIHDCIHVPNPISSGRDKTKSYANFTLLVKYSNNNRVFLIHYILRLTFSVCLAVYAPACLARNLELIALISSLLANARL
jgi:hypothetical protein